MAVKHKCKLTKRKARKVLNLIKFICTLKKTRQEVAIKYLNDEGVDYVCETIFNILYNPQCTNVLSSNKKTRLIKKLRPHSSTFQSLANKKYPLVSKRQKILQSGSGLSLLLSAAIPFLASLLLPRK